MNVPLTRLYNFLYQLSNNSKICFYRFWPHGSKRIEDLTDLLDHYSIVMPGHATFMICHDQEPLHWNLYSSNPGCQVNLRAVLSLSGHAYNYVLLLHSEQNSVELERYQKNRFVGVYYWSHAVIASDWFRHAKVDPLLNRSKTIKHDFLIYNRAWTGTREYRLKFVELLIDNQLVPNCNIKFNPLDGDTHYKNHVFENTDLTISNFKIEDMLELNTFGPDASADYNSVDYSNTAIEVVLETLFDDDRWHLTEKTLRPIACGQPFILAATAGSLGYLQRYGFKTFSGLIDETYDTITNPVERLTAIINEMSRISKLTADQKQLLYNKLNKIAKFNQQHFFSDAFSNQVLDEYKFNLEQGIAVISNFHAKLHNNQTQ